MSSHSRPRTRRPQLGLPQDLLGPLALEDLSPQGLRSLEEGWHNGPSKRGMPRSRVHAGQPGQQPSRRQPLARPAEPQPGLVVTSSSQTAAPAGAEWAASSLSAERALLNTHKLLLPCGGWRALRRRAARLRPHKLSPFQAPSAPCGGASSATASSSRPPAPTQRPASPAPRARPDHPLAHAEQGKGAHH